MIKIFIAPYRDYPSSERGGSPTAGNSGVVI
jgi:hypothetical protein